MTDLVILASSSPRRQMFFKNLGIDFKICVPDVDESVLENENAIDYVLRMAKIKALKVASLHTNNVVVAADTIVVLDNNILGKPKDREDAFLMIKSLSNKTHQVITAVSMIKDNIEKSFYEVTDVTFANLSDELIRDYVSTGESDDKSGSYAIQGIGASLIKEVHGSVSSVVGLPVCQTREVLESFNIFAKLGAIHE